jgi:hypothetical protein
MSSNPLEDDPKRDRRIRERAYHLWKTEGEPHGRDAEFWERARELVGMEESAGAGQISPAADAAHRINGQIVDEAALEENLGEFPGRQTDQGERLTTPMRKAKAAPVPAMAAPIAAKAKPAIGKSKPVAAKASPAVSKPQPVATKPAVAKPAAAKSTVAKPAPAKPVAAKPVATKPATGKAVPKAAAKPAAKTAAKVTPVKPKPAPKKA